MSPAERASVLLRVVKSAAENDNRAAEKVWSETETCDTGRMHHETFLKSLDDGQSLDFSDTETILSRFRKTRIILTGTDAESDDSDTEEEATLFTSGGRGRVVQK
ncbi:hypothetical protein NL108_013403 [Boleophthalmus pectinirostris]|nr:hypothetical protein NL108_013403 [Boleophthalmus pectinirostris]